ncbi:unnamed protein product [Lathyrus sativus]|nr:unnamed protein product [Lathyrus sativus]
MKIKCFIFAFFLCALIFITVVAIEPSKDDEKQTGVFENSKIKLGVNTDRRLREGGHGGKRRKRHHNADLQFWINGGGWGGSLNIGGVQDGAENIGLGGQEERRNEVSSIGEENKDLEEKKKLPYKN